MIIIIIAFKLTPTVVSKYIDSNLNCEFQWTESSFFYICGIQFYNIFMNKKPFWLQNDL